jgi:hypothetical protein
MRPFAAVLIALTGSAPLGAQSPARIPLTAGLTKVNAVVNIRNPDYESFETIERIDAAGVHVLFSGPTIKKSVRRTVRLEDMKSSSYYLLRYVNGSVPLGQCPRTVALDDHPASR